VVDESSGVGAHRRVAASGRGGLEKAGERDFLPAMAEAGL
jgi:hypothetical protein